MNKKMKEEIKNAFDIPEAIRREAFLKELPYPKASNLEVLITQFGYIRKRFWVLSLIAIIYMLYYLKNYVEAYQILGLLSSILPFLSILGIIEIQRSSSYNMGEMEMVCRHNLGQVILIRLVAIGSFYFIILNICLIFVMNTSQYGIFRSAIYLSTPFLFSSYISILISNYLHTKDILYVCGSVTGVICVLTGFITRNFSIIYQLNTMLFWSISFILLLLLLFIEIRKLIKRMGEVKWSLQLVD